METKIENILTIKYEYTTPIPLNDYQKSLSAINKQYKKYNKNNKEKSHLCIKEIKKGSIEIELISISIVGLLYTNVEFVNNIIQLITYMKNLFDKIKNKNDEYDILEIDMLDTSDMSNFVDIIKPSISGNGSIHLHGNINNSPINVNIYNSEAKEIEKKYKEIKKINSNCDCNPSDIHENVLLKITQINNISNSIANTKGTIDDIIENKELPINLPLQIWDKIINMDDNPFKYLYTVNVRYDECENIYFITSLIDKTEI
jgi:hypothetical protein